MAQILVHALFGTRYRFRISTLISPVSGASETFLSKSKVRIPKSPLYSQLHHPMLFSSNTDTMSS